MLEDIGEGDDPLLCKTNQTVCCRRPYTGEMGSALGNWFFPNGTRFPSSGIINLAMEFLQNQRLDNGK